MRRELDLFGQPLPAAALFRKDGQRRKLGYAARPGSGPKKQRCSTCLHCLRVEHSRDYSYKCQLTAGRWTRDGATDIKPNAPACSEWDRGTERQVGKIITLANQP